MRIASEYPNLAELFARSARLRRYRVQAVWGAAEAYPPEDADCVVTAISEPSTWRHMGCAAPRVAAKLGVAHRQCEARWPPRT